MRVPVVRVEVLREAELVGDVGGGAREERVLHPPLAAQPARQADAAHGPARHGRLVKVRPGRTVEVEGARVHVGVEGVGGGVARRGLSLVDELPRRVPRQPRDVVPRRRVDARIAQRTRQGRLLAVVLRGRRRASRAVIAVSRAVEGAAGVPPHEPAQPCRKLHRARRSGQLDVQRVEGIGLGVQARAIPRCVRVVGLEARARGCPRRHVTQRLDRGRAERLWTAGRGHVLSRYHRWGGREVIRGRHRGRSSDCQSVVVATQRVIWQDFIIHIGLLGLVVVLST